MSGLIGKLKGFLSSSAGETVTNAIEEHVTRERIDGVLDRVPGGDLARDNVPEDAGQQVADAARGFAGDGEKK